MEPIDCTGLSCPQPVLNTRAYLLNHPDATSITIWVDNPASAENVRRFLENQGFQTRIDQRETRIEVTGDQTCTIPSSEPSDTEPDAPRTLVLIGRDVMGEGDRELGSKLMLNFIKTLPEMGDSLWRIVCINAGVKLTIEGAETLPDLQRLEKQGVSILVCGTCLTHFGLLDQKRTGETTNMLDVVMSLQHAEKVITL